MMDGPSGPTDLPLVIVLQPYIPEYRVEFFEKVSRTLHRHGFVLRVVSGAPSPSQAARGDQVSGGTWHHYLAKLRPLPGGLVLRRISSVVRGDVAVVVGELASSSIDTWRLLLLGRVRSKTRVLVWGHVNNYVNDESWLGRKTKRLMARMSDGVLAYTADGAATARAWLGGGKEVTVLNNSRATPTFPDQSDGEHKPRLIFIGGLDRSKRLDELILVGQALASRVADFELVVIGDGPDRSYIQAAAANYAWLKYVGRKAGDEKWAMIASAAGILMPGRVGLVVIDSFASQVPIVTQTWRYHAPEFSYLVHEANALIGDGPGSLTEQAHRLLTEPGLRDRLAAGCRASREIYSLDQMVQNFVDAVVHAAARGGHYPTRRPESYSVD